jgi:hypothetical protein
MPLSCITFSRFGHLCVALSANFSCHRYRWGSSPLFTKEPTPESSPEGEYPGRRRPEKLVVEFSSPNIAKPFHVGHFRFNLLIPSVNLTQDQILEIVPQNKGLSPLSMCYVSMCYLCRKWYKSITVRTSTYVMRAFSFFLILFRKGFLS